MEYRAGARRSQGWGSQGRRPLDQRLSAGSRRAAEVFNDLDGRVEVFSGRLLITTGGVELAACLEFEY